MNIQLGHVLITDKINYSCFEEKICKGLKKAHVRIHEDVVFKTIRYVRFHAKYALK